MRIVVMVAASVLMAPAGCSQVARMVLHELGIAAEKEAGQAGRAAEREAAEAAARARAREEAEAAARASSRGDARYATWAREVRFDDNWYWLRYGGGRISAQAVRLLVRQYGLSGSGSDEIDEQEYREVAAVRLHGQRWYGPLTCRNVDGSSYAVPSDSVACLNGARPSQEIEMDLNILEVRQ